MALGCARFAVVTILLAGQGCSPVQPVRANVSRPVENARDGPPKSGHREIRATGTIQAVRAFTVQVPQISIQTAQNNNNNGRVTLIKLVPNGTKVAKDDLLAEFDRTAQLDAALEAKAKAIPGVRSVSNKLDVEK